MEECNCKEMSCKIPCTKDHTCKTFFCEKCDPQKCKDLYSPKLQNPMKGEHPKKVNRTFQDLCVICGGECICPKEETWEDRFDKLNWGVESSYNGEKDEIKSFINQELEIARREEREKIDNKIIEIENLCDDEQCGEQNPCIHKEIIKILNNIE